MFDRRLQDYKVKVEEDHVNCVREKEGELRSSEARESAGEKAPAGTALSLSEKIERSSPFH